MSLFLLDGPAWPQVGHPFGTHTGCGGLLTWAWVPSEGMDTTASVRCRRCGCESYAWPNSYVVDSRNTEPSLELLAADVPDDDEDVAPAWRPGLLEAYAECHEHPAMAEWRAAKRAACGAP